jgi:hypothetical protein
MAQRDRREYHQRWYQEHKEAEKARSRARYRQNPKDRLVSNERYKKYLRDLINEHKKAGACIRCGIADYRVLDFHHRDPSQKKIGLNLAWKQHVGKQVILDEIAKCDLICANCHRILHWEERNGT